MSTLQTPAAPRPQVATKSKVNYVEYEKYIESQVERTRRAVKVIELTQAALVLAIGLLALLLTAAVIEHWLTPGGFGSFGRLMVFAVIMGCGGYYLVRSVWPLIVQSINPTYAAHAIEREHPSLKNSLVNFLLFRSSKRKMPAAVYEALEQQAAQRLSQTPVDGSVDRSVLVKLGYILLGIVVAFASYAVLSPKSSWTTAARVLMPWAEIAPPSRVRIDSVSPGQVEVVQGESLDVKARIKGLREGELVEVVYDTADGHLVDQRVAMQPLDDAGFFQATIPGASSNTGLTGIDQDLMYRIVAGDGRTIDYAVGVITAPTIRVAKVRYDFPEYTGYIDRTIDYRGDIRAIEGTKVTIFASANTDIESASVDLASDGRPDLRMRVEGSNAQADLKLSLEDRRQAIRTTSYMLRYTSTDGLENDEPPQHSLEVLPDYAPEIEIVEPESRGREVQLNETVTILLDARDPDFALQTVKLHFAKQDGTQVHEAPLLDKKHDNRWQGKWDFTPLDLGLKAGDVVEYWAVATDVRTPQANRTETSRKLFQIVGDPNQPNQQRGDGQQGEGAPQEGQNGEDGQPQEGQPNQDGNNGDNANQQQPGEGQSQEGQNGEGQNGEAQNGPNEGNPPQDSENGGEGQQNPNAGGQQNQNGNNQQPNDAQSGEGGDANQNPGESPDGTPNNQVGDSSEKSNNSDGSRDGQQNESGDKGRSDENGQAGQESERVASDGSDDATAFDKIKESLDRKNQQQAEQQPGEGSDNRDNASENNSGDGNAGEGSQPQQQPNGNQPREGQSGERPDAGGQGNPQDANAGQPREGQPDSQSGDSKPEEAEGSGADTQNDAPEAEGGTNSGTEPDAASSSDGGEERNSSGDPGSGSDTKPEGSPDAQREMQQRNKRPGTEEQANDSNEAPTPGHSKHESDSQGEQGGDRAGGGEEGGGQKSPRDGTGSAGQNQAADEGAGQSADRGPGEAGQRAGDSEIADGETGNAGDEQGNGSSSRKSEQGDSQQSGRPGESGSDNGSEQTGQPAADQNAQNKPEGQANERQPSGDQANDPNQQQRPGEPQQDQRQPAGDANQQSGQSGTPNGQQPSGNGGEGGIDEGQNPPREGTLAEGDEANLEYTRKQTDLVLDKLADQLKKDEVDQEMLDKLGWSQDDLRKFVDRWNRLRSDAKGPDGGAAKQELDARLRGLGKSLGSKGGKVDRTADDFRNLSEGYQNKVPLKYRDRLKAYTEGVSRGE